MFFKKNFIKDNGYLLIATEQINLTISLYSWQKFLFEQYYDRRTCQITCIRLASYKDLEKYMNEISLTELHLVRG